MISKTDSFESNNKLSYIKLAEPPKGAFKSKPVTNISETSVTPSSASILQKASVNKEIKKRSVSGETSSDSLNLYAKTFSGTVFSTLAATGRDPIKAWTDNLTGILYRSGNYKEKLKANFGSLDPEYLKTQIYDLTLDILRNEQKNEDWFPFYHAGSPTFTMLYTLQTVLKNFLTVQSGGETNHFRWNTVKEENSIHTIDELKQIATDTTRSDADTQFRDHGLCAVPSIFTNVDSITESALHLWFSSTSIGIELNEETYLQEKLKQILQALCLPLNLIEKFIDKFLEKCKPTYPLNAPLYQIFIHPDSVNELVYLSGNFGFPIEFSLNPTISDSEICEMGDKANDEIAKRIISMKGARTVLESYKNGIKDAKFKTDEPEFIYGRNRNPRNESSTISHIGNTQARILYKPEIFDDRSKVRVEEYFIDGGGRFQLEAFKQTVEDTFKEILEEFMKLTDNGSIDLSDVNTHYPLFKLANYIKTSTHS